MTSDARYLASGLDRNLCVALLCVLSGACQDGTVIATRATGGSSGAPDGDAGHSASGAVSSDGGRGRGEGNEAGSGDLAQGGQEPRGGRRGNGQAGAGDDGGDAGQSGGRAGASDGTAGTGIDQGGAGTGQGGTSAGASGGGTGGGTAGSGGGVGPTPSCSDGIRNQDEEGTDCGGSCKQCGGTWCEGNTACASGVCAFDECRDQSCMDGIRSAGETAIDCGGSCGACTGERCEFFESCASLVCDDVCLAPTCDDDVKNGDETGEDCGGSCARCPNEACTESAECASRVCAGGVCRAPSCTDGVTNGRERGLDCGASCGACGGAGCSSNDHCASGWCTNYQCTTSTCDDGLKNGAEEDVDCGGRCGKCAGSVCKSGAECQSKRCVDLLCAAPSCNDDIKNGYETATDCGGFALPDTNECRRCTDSNSCRRGADCRSGVCEDQRCQAPSCEDGQKNGAELWADCGGNCAACESRAAACTEDAECPSQFCNDGRCMLPPSCRGASPPLCQGRDCCAAPLVPGGSFLVGGDPAKAELGCVADAQNSHLGTVSSFRLDMFEVTVGRFRKFVDAGAAAWKASPGAGAHPKIPESGWRAGWDAYLPTTRAGWDERLTKPEGTWSPSPSSRENRPINAVNWFEAFAFCIWDGGRLPTELEWEYAAAGGGENRPYPWGDERPRAALAAFSCDGNCDGTLILDVGSKWLGQGRWGHQDLAGNMGEWVFDHYDFRPFAHLGEPCQDCAHVGMSGTTRVTRGGYPTATAAEICATRRHGAWDQDNNTLYSGFRCARDLPGGGT